MTYRAPIPVGPENEAMTDTLTASRAFTEAMTALTDSSLTLKEIE